MNLRAPALLAAALAIAGCAAPATTTATSDPLSLGDAVTTRYQTQALMASDAAISRVEASSTRPSAWFSTDLVTDGNYHSAWGPAEDDAAPSLLVTLTRPVPLSALGIKLCDRDVTFDVATANTEGGFTTIATGLTPDYYAMDSLDLPAGPAATQVKLTFHVPKNRQLLVCELKLFGEHRTAVAAPAPTATPAPSDSHHFYVEGDSYGATWGPFRIRDGNTTYKLTFKTNVPEAQTRFIARVKTASGVTLLTYDYQTFKDSVYYLRNYSVYAGFEVGGDGWATPYFGQDLYFEVVEATGYFQYIVADDNGWVLDYTR